MPKGDGHANPLLMVEDRHDRYRTERNALSVSLRQLLQIPSPRVSERPRGDDSCLAACRLVAEALGFDVAIPATAPVEGETVIDRAERIAGCVQLRCRRVRLDGSWWRGDGGSMIAAWRDTGAPLVLLPRPAGGYDAVDPQGSRAKLTRRSAAALGPEALLCYAAMADADATPRRMLAVAARRRMLAVAARGMGPDLLTFAATAVATGLLALAAPLAATLLFQDVIPHAETGGVAQIVCGLTLLALGGGSFELAKAAALARLEVRLARGVSAALIDRMLRLPTRFFAGFAAGDLADRLRGVDEIRRLLTGVTIATLVSGVFSSLSLILLVWVDAKLAFACAGLLVVAMAVSLAFNVAALRWERVAMRERGGLDGLVVQLVVGISKVRAAAAEQRAMRIWAERFAVMRAALVRADEARTGLQVFAAMLPLVLMATMVGGTALLNTGSAAGALSLGDFMVFSAALGNLLAAMLSTSMQLTSTLRAVPLYERALPIFRAAPERPAGMACLSRSSIARGKIEFIGVSFRYDPGGPWALSDLSLRIAPGEMAAIVGPSGSGKSTVMRLLLGFERPERGTILIDGTPLEQFDIGALRRSMGVVLQQSRLSPGNIYQNIVSHTGLGLEAAWEAARLAGLAADIEAMPMGMHTTVMENGQGLSGGQRQRLAIARAIVAKPGLILFDEATSALDNRTQDIVSRSLAANGGTRIVIAHRLSTIARADRIFALDQGHLAQSGTYDALLAAPGLFRELSSQQLLSS